MQLTKIVYASNHGGLEDAAVEAIVIKSRINNERDGITGVLIACEEDFLQVLEGERTVVAECFMRIMKDDRHQKINIIVAGEAEARLFPKWNMHSIEASQHERDILVRHMANGAFNPAGMEQAEIEELCRELATAAQKDECE